MTETSRVVATTPDRVFAVLADGWAYASWVVGAAHIRDVDAGWPAVGTRIHHKIGPWPFQIKDQTVVRVVDPDRYLELDARMWPVGAAVISLRLEEVSAGRTLVRMREKLTSGLPSLAPDPVQALLLRPRNSESLHRLDDIAVNRRERRQAS